jgi:hypothetical protein
MYSVPALIVDEVITVIFNFPFVCESCSSFSSLFKSTAESGESESTIKDFKNSCFRVGEGVARDLLSYSWKVISY